MLLAERPNLATVERLAELGVTSIVLSQYLISDQPDSPEAVLDGISSFGELISGWQD
jgi:hypothetical protein